MKTPSSMVVNGMMGRALGGEEPSRIQKALALVDKADDGQDVKDCVKKKIPIIYEDHPEWEQAQVVAVAFSMCRKDPEAYLKGHEGECSCGGDHSHTEEDTEEAGKPPAEEKGLTFGLSRFVHKAGSSEAARKAWETRRGQGEGAAGSDHPSVQAGLKEILAKPHLEATPERVENAAKDHWFNRSEAQNAFPSKRGGHAAYGKAVRQAFEKMPKAPAPAASAPKEAPKRPPMPEAPAAVAPAAPAKAADIHSQTNDLLSRIKNTLSENGVKATADAKLGGWKDKNTIDSTSWNMRPHPTDPGKARIEIQVHGKDSGLKYRDYEERAGDEMMPVHAPLDQDKLHPKIKAAVEAMGLKVHRVVSTGHNRVHPDVSYAVDVDHPAGVGPSTPRR